MESGLKWVHMARYELILRLEGALWLRIIFKPLLTPKRAIQIQQLPKQISKLVGSHWNNWLVKLLAEDLWWRTDG